MPGFIPLLCSTLLSRTALTMSAIAFVLFGLQRFHSAAVAGLTVFLLAFPGLLLSPVSGALLDRFGRTRMMMLDFSVAACGVLLVALLGRVGGLSVGALLGIVSVVSLTSTLSAAGSRTMFPLVVPGHLWERANAVDTLCYGVATVAGPGLAGQLTLWFGGPGALLGVAVTYAIAAGLVLLVREPEAPRHESAGVLRDAARGIRYVITNPTLRWLAASMFVLNIGWGVVEVALPVRVLQIHGNAGIVGALFAAEGLVGIPASLLAGRLDTRRRERALMAVGFVVMALSTLLLLLPSFAWLALGLAIVGIADGPINVCVFTLRQRRTPPQWFGRAFAISMALNFSGMPLGSAISGPLIGRSPEVALAIAAALPLAAALIVWRIPARAGLPQPTAA